MSKDSESIVDRLAENCHPVDDAYINVTFTVSRLLPKEDSGAYKEIMNSVDELCGRISESYIYVLLERLEYMNSQHHCGCDHPHCNRCEDERVNEMVINSVKEAIQ